MSLADETTADLLVPLAERSLDPKRFAHASRALAVLEADLRTLLESEAVDAEIVRCASEMYRSARRSLVGLLEDDDAQAAAGELGMPELGEDAGFGELLLALSQATRWVGVEENWPAMAMAATLQRRQLEGAGEKLMNQFNQALAQIESPGSYL